MNNYFTLLKMGFLLKSVNGFLIANDFSSMRLTTPEMTTFMKVTGIESTPNPSSFKFALDEIVQSGSTRGFTYTTSTASLAPENIQRVLEIAGVESVYALSDWVCLNKAPSAKWDSIVTAAVHALGGAAETLDPLTLVAASGAGEGSGWIKSDMDGIAIRVQFSNGIPIQVEACSPGGTPLRRKLSVRFAEAMATFVGATGDEMAFFKGRQWIDRGVRYPSAEDDPDTVSADVAEAALDAAVAEIEQAFHDSRLKDVVAEAIARAEVLRESDGGSSGHLVGADPASTKAGRVHAAASALQSPEAGDIIAAVDTLCELSSPAAQPTSRATVGEDEARDALDALIGFAGSGEGPIAARRAAVAFVGGAGEAAGSAGLQAVAAVFRGDKNPGVRRTAGDALSDLGDAAAVPIALTGLRDKSKLVRWRAARVVGELGTQEKEADLLDEARGREAEFEVAFEMADASRKIRSRISGDAGGLGAGPVWKQIQERGSSS